MFYEGVRLHIINFLNSQWGEVRTHQTLLGLFFMAKDPAVLLYTSDFLSGTFTMTDEQVGKYIRLLCLQHQKGKLTEKDMLSICKAYDEDIFCKFELVDGHYINKRMYEEAFKRSRFTESRRKNASAKHMPKHMENEIENEIENRNINTINTEFKEIWEEWKLYKKEEHRDRYKSPKTEQKAFNNLYNLAGGDLETAREIVNYSIANKYKGLFELKTKFKKETKLETYTNWLDELNNNHENTAKQTDIEVKRISF